MSFFLIVFFISCASAPRASFLGEETGQEISQLPAGARVYLWADTVQARPLLDILSFDGISGKDVAPVLDSTTSATAAIFPDGASRRFFLMALGTYPRIRANISMTFSKGWQKQKSIDGSSFWYSEENDIAVALGPKLALVSNTDPFEDFEVEVPPRGFIEFSRSMALAAWMNDPSTSINNFMDSMGIPLQVPAEDFFFGVEKKPQAQVSLSNVSTHNDSPAAWELVFRIRTSSDTQARSLLTLFSLARLFALRGINANESTYPLSPQGAAALLFANMPEQDGESLILRTGPLHEAGIALLFDMFLLYSN